MDPDAPDEGEDGEAMEVTNDVDDAMMAAMGLSGFGSTKVSCLLVFHFSLEKIFHSSATQGKHVDGNQEGAVDLKKMRTWRQYMNRCVV